MPDNSHIDPMISLAFSLSANKGTYAMLLGSGLSRAAQIPTGWEIVLDLVNKVARLSGEDCGTDPAGWYRGRYGHEPDYSRLLEQLARSPEDRQQLLRAYFEPTADELDQKLKQPTAAHRAIAALVLSGHVRIIVTTNFDRLLERAIEQAGVSPVVIASPDAITGALPLTHQRCCVIKLHGDYLDTRIRNSPSELERYDPPTRRLLARVFEEFGLVVCGWSARWDPALRLAVDRTRNRRFTAYWATRGEPDECTSRLVVARRGVVIPIQGADEFFVNLQDKVAALEDSQEPHPLSVTAATALAKRFLADGSSLIKFHDLVYEETERSFAALQPVLGSIREGVDATTLERATDQLLAGTRILRAALIQGAYWGAEDHRPILVHAIERLATEPRAGHSGSHLDESIRAIPAVFLLYAAAMAATLRRNWGMLGALLTSSMVSIRNVHQIMIHRLGWHTLHRYFKMLPGYKNMLVATSEWLFDHLRDDLRDLVPGDADYSRAFDTFELIRSLVFSELWARRNPEEAYSGLPGRFGYSRAHLPEESAIAPLIELSDDPKLLAGLSQAGLFANDAAKFSASVGALTQYARQLAQEYR